MHFLCTQTFIVCIYACVVNGAIETISGKVLQWFVGCYNNSSAGPASGLSKAPDCQGLHPITCSQRCLDGGYDVAALSGETCYCGYYGMEGLVARECPDSSTKGESDTVPQNNSTGWCCDSVCLPCGDGKDMLAVYRTLGPYIRNVSLAVLTDTVHSGMPFLLEVSGYLAAPPTQPIGIYGLEGENLSSVDVQFSGKGHKDQSSHTVIVQDDGFFTFSSDWMLENPGTYQIKISVSNLLSQLFSSLYLSVLRPSPEGLEVSLVQGQGGTPYCLPYPAQDTLSQALEKAYLGDILTLQAYVGAGIRLQFHWRFFSDAEKEEEEEGKRRDVKIDCLPDSDCLSSTVNQLFKTEGIHTVKVNASNIYGWTEKTIHIAVVRRVVCDLTLESRSGYHLAAGQNISVDLQLYTTQRQSLLLNLTLTYQGKHSVNQDHVHNLNQTFNHDDADHENNQNHDQTEDHNLNQNQTYNFTLALELNHNQTHGHDNDDHTVPLRFTHTLSLSSYPQPSSPLHLRSSYGQTSCHLQYHLHYPLPSTVGQYTLSATVFSLSDPAVPLLSACLPCPLVVYDRIRTLWPAGTWSSVVQSRSELNLTVTSQADCMGSKVLWTVARGNTTVFNRITEAWTVTMTFSIAGTYLVTVKAFNPISWVGFHTHFLVQDPVGELLLNVPRVVTVDCPTAALFTITTGSNMSVVVLTNTSVLYQNNNYTAGEEVSVGLLFDCTGTTEVEVRAENLVSSENRSVNVCVQLVRKWSHTVTMDITLPPVTGPSLALSTKVNAVLILAHEVTTEEPIGDVLLVLATSAVIRLADFIKATAIVVRGGALVFEWQVSLPELTTHSHTDRNTSVSSLHHQAVVPGMYNITVTTYCPLGHTSVSRHLEVRVHGPVGHVQVQYPFGLDWAALHLQAVGTYATSLLLFRGHSFSHSGHFLFDFGDGLPTSYVNGVSHLLGKTTSTYHQFTKEGVFQIRVWAYNEFYRSMATEHVFYVEKVPAGLELSANSSVVHKNQVVLFEALLEQGTNVSYTWSMGDQTTYVNAGAVVSHMFLSVGAFEVCVLAENKVGSVSHCVPVSVLNRMQSVSIHTEKQAYATNTDITFQAQTEAPDPVEFLWHFGDSRPLRTTSRSFKKTYHTPDRYSVVVVASNGLSSFTSEVHPVLVQIAVRPNRLLFQPSVVLKHTASFTCRVNSGTNLSFSWSFGDGTSRTGGNTEQHVFHRTGEFTVEVTVSNLVSSASLTAQMFVVDRPCKPPAVKNMGPLKIQVRRYEPVGLGVTYEAEVQCDVFQGLEYNWSLYTSTGLPVPLPPVDTDRQSITLPSHFLHYGIYTAIARVQIVGSVVYSNYSVCVEVVPSPLVSFIHGGTNVFLSSRNSSVISLNGQLSYDPDYPMNHLSYSWTCKPVSAIDSSCFDQYVPTSFSVIVFPVGFLKRDFDQFRFTLTVQSGERSSTADTFITVTPSLLRRVSVYCYQCQGDAVNWDQSFSVRAVCDSCGPSPRTISYTWTLYLVNSSSKVDTDVPFCHSVDLNFPSNIIGGPTFPLPPALTLTPPSSPPHTPSTTASVMSSSTEISSNMTSIPASLVTGLMSSNVTSNTEIQTTTPTTPDPVPVPPFPPLPPFPLPSPSPGGRPRKQRSQGSVELQRINSTAGNNPSPNSSPEPISVPISFTPESPEPDLGGFDPGGPPYPISEYPVVTFDDGSILYSAPLGQSDIVEVFPIDPDFPTDYDFPFPVLESGDVSGRPVEGFSPGQSVSGGVLGPFPGSDPSTAETSWDPNGTLEPSGYQTGSYNLTDYNVPFLGIEEGDPGVSVGRPTGVGGGSSEGDSPPVPGSSEDEGSNLMDSSPSLVVLDPTLLDLPRELLEQELFESYTYTGISSALITFRPFTLRAGSRYMLEVTANSHDAVLGRTQLFLSTSPSPRGITCQVQPSSGFEIHTHFSIFCTSGKEDLLYEYSFSTGNSPPKILYQGRDFQYYFNLPSGDPQDDYKVTIYTAVRNRFGAATAPCPVTVTVHPSFIRNTSSNSNPDMELFESGLRNLSGLVQLGNSVEIRNYIILLSSVLNRLSQDPTANTPTQTHTRTALINAVCQLDINDQRSMTDNVYMLKDLMHLTHQVSLASASVVVGHVQSISDLFHEPSVPVPYLLDSWTLNTLVTLLSYSLQATPTTNDVRQDQATADDVIQATPTLKEQAIQLTTDSLQTTDQLLLKYILFNKVEQHNVTTSVMDLQTTHHDRGLTTVISSGSATFYLPDSLDLVLYGRRRRETTDGPQSLCVLSQLTTFTHNLYFWTKTPVLLSGPVIDLTLYNCSTRREIPVRSLSQPINIEFPKTPRNVSSLSEFTLLRSQVNYHGFNITQQALQEAILVSVEFTRPPNKTFPIMLLFRMFERPTPSLYHIHSIHHWDRNTTYITLPPSYLTAAGTGYLALLNADYKKTPRHKYMSRQVNYTLRLESSQCLSWDHQKGWTHTSCTPQLGLTTHTRVNCSCSHLSPLTVVQQQIQSSHDDSADLAQFISLPSDVTVVCVCVVCVCLYALGMVVCKRADLISERNQGVYYLSDNAPSDTHLYSVTIHTGLRSSPSMTAKVHIVLYGEDGASQTRQLHDPECPLFRRNSRNTFILSTVDSLGPLWGLHLWHDNTGPSPTWYLRQVKVCEVKGKGRSWLFLGQCWLAVDEGDGQVERRLRVCDQGPGFTKLLYLKLSEYLSDFHLWLSVYSGPSPSVFTHTQRLSVCLLLLLGYMCVNTLLISGLDDQYTLELGIIDVSAVSLTTGLFSALAVLPVATSLSFLFRQREVRVKRSEVKQDMVRLPDIYSIEADALIVSDCVFDSLSWNNLQQWAQEAWRKKYEGSVPNRDLVTQRGDLVIRGGQDLVRDLLTQEKVSSDCNSSGFDNSLLGRLLGNSVPDNNSVCKERDRNLNDSPKLLGNNQVGNSTSRCLGGRLSPLLRWSHLLAWVLCLALGLSSLVITIILGIRFSSSKTLLWIHSVFFSLLSCVFLIQPAMILAVAVVVSFWRRNRPDFSSFSGVPGFQAETLKLWTQDGSCVPELFLLSPPHPPQERCSHFDRVLAARQRARYLRLVRPPTSGELRRTGGRKRRETLIRKTLREMAVCVSMLFLLLCVTYGSSFRDQYHLNHAVRTQFTRSPHNPFLSIQTHEEWWNWTLTSVLDGLDWDTWYNNISATGKAGAVQGSCILIGEPILRKIDVFNASQCQVPPVMETLFPECLTAYPPGERVSGMALPMEVGLHICGQLQCYTGTGTTVRLGLTRSEMGSRLESLRSAGWLDRLTVAMATQFTLYSPSTNLFISVNLMAERLPGGALHTSARVQSARVYHSPTVWDYFSMACQLLFLLVSLVQLVLQICSAGEKGMLGYLRDPQSWLQVGILLVTLVYYIYYIYQSILTLEVIDLLQRHDFRTHVDVSLLSTWEQHTRTLRGILLFLLVVRCMCLSGVNRTMAASVTLLRLAFSRLLWPMLSGVVLLVALSSVGNLLLLRRSWGFSSLPHSVFTLPSLSRGQLGSRAPSLPMASQPHQLHSPNSLSLSFYHGALCLTLTVAWTAVLIGIVSSLVRAAKLAGRRRSLLTLCDVVGYVRGQAAVLIGQRRQRWRDSHAHRRSFYLEEFESLVDELQFRLNAFSNSLHHTLPPKDIFSPTQSPSSLASQRSAASETAHMTEETLLNDPPDITSLPLTSREHLPDAHHYRSQLELETLHHLQQSGQRRQTPAPVGGLSSRIGTSGSLLHSGAPGRSSREHLSDRNLQSSTSTGGPSYLSSPDSVHLAEAWTWDNMPQIQSLTGWIDNQLVKTVVLENQISHWTTVGRSGKKSHRSPRNTQWATVEGPSSRYTTASGVVEGHGGPHRTVVEVMVHGRPETEPEEEGILGTVRQCWG